MAAPVHVFFQQVASLILHNQKERDSVLGGGFSQFLPFVQENMSWLPASISAVCSMKRPPILHRGHQCMSKRDEVIIFLFFWGVLHFSVTFLFGAVRFYSYKIGVLAQ